MEEFQKGIIFDIKRYAVNDGPGIRVTVFLKGCPLRCWWCHNPESHRKLPENCEKPIRLDGCPELSENSEIGQRMSIMQVMAEIEKDVVFFDESGGGVTFSGGEPLVQHGFLLELLKTCRQHEIHTTLDTTGYATAQVLESILPFVDLFLYDLKLMG